MFIGHKVPALELAQTEPNRLAAVIANDVLQSLNSRVAE